MVLLSISAAARAVGKDRSTLHRFINKGKLSTNADPVTGAKCIDTSELIRVFGPLVGDGSISDAATVASAVENSTTQQAIFTTVEVLKEQLRLSQLREQKLLAMLEREQEARRNLEQRLLPASSTEQKTLQGEYQASNEDAQTETGDGKGEHKGFWARLFGG